MGRVFVTGDTHGSHSMWKLSSENFDVNDLGKDDYVIICGDFGLVWCPDGSPGSGEDGWWLDWLEEKPFTTLFVDGNHENHDMLSAFPVEEWNGGRVHRIREGVIHLMRGQVFDIAGMSIFTMGGAYSHDIKYRTEGESWWRSEVPDEEERAAAVEALNVCGWKVDYVITHCAPSGVLPPPRISDPVFPDEYTDWLEEEIASRLNFKRWYFGHYHRDRSADGGYRFIYNDICEIESGERVAVTQW